MTGELLSRRTVLVGHPFAPIGMGEHIRSSFRAFRSLNQKVGLRNIYAWDTRDDPYLESEIPEYLVGSLERGVNIFYINGDEVKKALWHLRTDMPSGAYNIIYPTWELSKYPEEWAEDLERFDEIWAPSRFVQESIAGTVSKPVLLMPLANEVKLTSFLSRRYYKIPESSFVFLFFFDFSSYMERKNPLAVLKAFDELRKRRPKDDLFLVIKAKGEERNRGEALRYRDYVSQFGNRTLFMNQVLTDNEIRNLIRCCDCFVSLHRSEGFGLGMIEAMFLGKPVIATGYSGNLEFMRQDNSCLVHYKLVNVPEGAYPFSSGQVWADPDIEDAVAHMHRLVCDRDYARGLGEAARRHVGLNFSYRAIGLRYLHRLEQIIALEKPGIL